PAVTPACNFPARRLLPSVVQFRPGFQTCASPPAFRSLSRRASEHLSYFPPERPAPLVRAGFSAAVRSSVVPLTCPFLYSPCGVPFGPSITVPGSAYLLLRLSALECLSSLADCMTYFPLCCLLRL